MNDAFPPHQSTASIAMSPLEFVVFDSATFKYVADPLMRLGYKLEGSVLGWARR